MANSSLIAFWNFLDSFSWILFNLPLLESMDMEPADTGDWLHTKLTSFSLGSNIKYNVLLYLHKYFFYFLQLAYKEFLNKNTLNLTNSHNFQHLSLWTHRHIKKNHNLEKKTRWWLKRVLQSLCFLCLKLYHIWMKYRISLFCIPQSDQTSRIILRRHNS